MRIQAPPFFLRDADDPLSAEPAIVQRFSNELNDTGFTEDWLQNLIHTNPELVPASDLEPVWRELMAVCRELPCPSGYIDNVFVTPQGYLVFVECKLWRNTEARRKVIAQILDYAKDIADWQYDDLTRAINSANKTTFENPLYECVKDHPEAADEIEFVDRVSRNLRFGRHLLLIVGDGIQENLVSLVEHVQGHMGLQFMLGLIEIGIFRLQNQGGLVIVPNIVAKTLIVERGVLRLESDGILVEEPSQVPASKKTHGRAAPFSEQEFFDELATSSAEAAAWLRSLLERLGGLGVTYDLKRSLILRYSPEGDEVFGLGYIDASGRFHTGHATWVLDGIGHVGTARAYLEDIAELVDGFIPEHENPGDWSVKIGNRSLNIEDLVGKEEAYLEIVERFLERIREVVESR
jgi:hypothetical protein